MRLTLSLLLTQPARPLCASPRVSLVFDRSVRHLLDPAKKQLNLCVRREHLVPSCTREKLESDRRTFMEKNKLASADVDKAVLTALLQLGTCADVIASPLFNDVAKQSFQRTWNKARAGDVDPALGARGWATQGLTRELLKRKRDTPDYGHPFDAAPDKCVQFYVAGDGNVTMLLELGSMKQHLPPRWREEDLHAGAPAVVV